MNATDDTVVNFRRQDVVVCDELPDCTHCGNPTAVYGCPRPGAEPHHGPRIFYCANCYAIRAAAERADEWACRIGDPAPTVTRIYVKKEQA